MNITKRTKRTAQAVVMALVALALGWAAIGAWVLLIVGVAVTVGVFLSGVGEQQRQREAWVAAGGKSRIPS